MALPAPSGRTEVTPRARIDCSTSHPAAVHRVMRADELEEGGTAFRVFVERALECGNDLSRITHILRVEAHRTRHRGHACRSVVRHLPRERVVSIAPEAGT